MEDKFRSIVEHIFNNWVGLQMAVDHSMGGPDSRQIALDCVDFMTNFCISEPNLEVDEIKETLEDIIDEDFNTIFEDGSPNEIANLLHRFALLLKEGNEMQCEMEFKNLPVAKKEWLIRHTPHEESAEIPETSAMNVESSDLVEPMEQDAEWTEVKTRRRK